MWLTLAGVAIGVAGALGVTRYLAALLFEVRPTDPAVFGAVLAILIATATIACYVPARRSMRVDPATVLRDE